jgi:hypothetical protein
MRDDFLSSIISRLHKLENISVVSFFVLGAVASMLFVPVSAYDENVSFDGDSSFNLINCSRIVWHIDPSIGHLSLPSLRSGPIQSGGASCVAKEIEGPARINFWWRVDQDTSQVGMLLFLVDDKIILQCTSSDWSPVDYAVPFGSHRLSWEYRKLRSYPEYVGAGWIDDLNIVYPKEQMPEVLPGGLSCCDQLPSIRGDLERMNGTLSRLETRVGQIKIDIGNLSSNQTTLEGLVGSHNLSGFEERMRQLDTKIGNVDRKIENLSFNQTATSNLSWIWENVVYISNKDNLTKVVNENRNKTIILADGVYHTGKLNITTSDVYIRSLRKWGAVIDADNARFGVVLHNVENVTIDSVAITDCARGILINKCTDCNIINNLITDFTTDNPIGIVVRYSNNSTVMRNWLRFKDIDINIGVMINNSSNNTFLFNEINLGIINRSMNSKSYESTNSKYNMIYISGNCRVFDNGLDFNIKEDDVSCEIRRSRTTCWYCSNNNSIENSDYLKGWTFNDWIFPNI